MAIEIGTAYVNIVPSARGLQANLAKELGPIRGIAAAEGQRAGTALGGQFGRGLQAAGLATTFKSQVGGLATAAKAVLATAGIGVFVRQSVNAASDLNESLSKVNVVFRDGAKEVDDWSKTTATGLGLSRQAALEAAGTFGNFLISMGLVPSKAQEMSVSMVKLAADLASFNNTSPEDALLAIRSGLAGEIEPLRRYGVALSANRIEQEAQAQGLNKTSAELSAAEKATLSYQIILKDTALAQGDFSRTSGGLANQQRILAARLADAEAKLGAFLVPLLLTGAKAATALGHGLAVANKATDGWLGSLAAAAVVGTGVFVAVNKISSGISGLISGFGAQAGATTAVTAATVTNTAATEAQVVANEELAASSVTAGQALTRSLTLGLTAVAAGFLLGKKAGDEIIKLTTDAPPKVDALTASLIRLGKGQKEAFDFATIGKDLRGQVDRAELSPGDSIKNVSVFVKAFRKDAREAKQDIPALNDALKSILATEGVDAATRAYGFLFQGLRDQHVAVNTLTGDFAPFQAALDLANAKEKDTSETTKDLTANFQNLSNVFTKEATTLGISDQFDAAQSALEELNQLKLDAQGQGPKSIDAARREEQAQNSLSDAYESQRKAGESLLEAKQNLAEFDSATDQRIRDLERTQIAARVVTTPEEARQKEIDLLKFDEDAKDQRERLQKQVADAEAGVASAAGRTAEAQKAVSDAAQARRQVQVDAAGAIAGAERQAEEAILNAGQAVLDARDKQLIGNQALDLYLQLLGELGKQVDPKSTLSQNLQTFLDRLSLSQTIAASLGPAGPQGPFGTGGHGSVVFLEPQTRTDQSLSPASAAKPSVTVNTTNNITAPDQPSRQTLDTLNRKQALRLSGSRIFT